jgi:inosose dehydratase
MRNSVGLSSGNPSRRSMLRLGAAGLAGLALGGNLPRLALAAGASDEYGGLPLGIQSYTLRDRPFKNAMEAMKNDFGLHYVEVYNGHVSWTTPPPKVDEAVAIMKANDVTVTSIGAVGINAKEEEARKIFDFAKKLGMKNITISPSPDAFPLLDKLVEEYNITASIHDHGPGDRWGKIATIEDAIKDHNKKIGLCNDTGHFIRAGEDPLDACKRLKDRMYAMHLKDFKKDAKGKWEDCVLGEGSLDVDGIVKFLLDMKFDGALSIEYEGGDPVESVKKSLDRIKAAVKKAKG